MEGSKLENLRAAVRGYGSCLVAYSGGVDSTFLALVAHQELGNRALAIIADSPSLPRSELEEALEIAARFGFAVETLRTGEFEDENYTSNPVNRCFFCKQALFKEMEALAADRGVGALLYGENASDIGDHRPGAEAARQFKVAAPLKEFGLTKDEIRAWSRALGLPTSEKHEMACLSSRIPYGEGVTPEKLHRIEGAEAALRKEGIFGARVRYHELGAQSLARLELPPSDFSRVLDGAIRERLVASLEALGFDQVTLDLRGYRRGSLNQGVIS